MPRRRNFLAAKEMPGAVNAGRTPVFAATIPSRMAESMAEMLGTSIETPQASAAAARDKTMPGATTRASFISRCPAPRGASSSCPPDVVGSAVSSRDGTRGIS